MVSKNRKHSRKELLWGRIATGSVFFVTGAGGGSWLGRLPDVQRNLHLNDAVLGLVILSGSIGGLIAMQGIPKLVKRFGHRAVLATIAPLYPLTMLGVPFAHSAFQLSAALFLFGAGGGVLGVVANTHAVDVEIAYERAIMSSFHAMFSVGSLIGAGIAGVLSARHVSVLDSMGGAMIVLIFLMLALMPRLLPIAHADPKQMDQSADHLSHHHHRKTWWRNVLFLGALTFSCYMAEGAIADWSALFMRDERHVGPALAVVAYVAFNICMATGRLLGDKITMKIGRTKTVQGGALLGAGGLLVGLLAPNTYAGIVGFAVVGCGLAALVPVLFSIAGNMAGGESHAAIARVSTIAFFGLLGGPAIIGYIAHHTGLTYALLVPCVMLTGVGLLAPRLRHIVKPQAQQQPQTQPELATI